MELQKVSRVLSPVRVFFARIIGFVHNVDGDNETISDLIESMDSRISADKINL